ncbi:WD repeat-containing protein 11-like [Ornithodoros turicata]|uniref:WD repeat-containing protein 11-like n=1 Tax=Ornithodoros turicata TaxID=34597 RepID=UPI0031391509
MSLTGRSHPDKRNEEPSSTPIIKKVSSRILPGALSTANKDAVEWGFQSLLAYGCHNHVIIVDTKFMKVFQTLSGHKHDVSKVRWAREMYYHDLVNPHSLKLATADTAGTILVWNVSQATVRSTLNDTERPVLELCWLTGSDSSHHLLVVLYSAGTFVLWNADNGTKIWKKVYTETLLSFCIDPFCESNISFLAPDCIFFVSDFSSSQAPAGNGKKLYISNQPSSSGSQLSLNSPNTPTADEKSKPKSRLLSGMKLLIKADSKSSGDEVLALNDCLQLSYHRSFRHHLLLLYSKEILILDMEIHQTVGIVALERNGSPFLWCNTCWQRDVLMCLHESGSVSVRVRHRDQSVPFSVDGDNTELFYEVSYDVRCISESLRPTRHSRVFGMAVCQKTERKVALLISDGRVVFLELSLTAQKPQGPGVAASPIMTPGLNAGFFGDFSLNAETLPKGDTRKRSTLADMIGPVLYSGGKGRGTCLKFCTVGLLTALSPGPHLTRMCPPVTIGNWTSYRPLLAVGNTFGGVQLFDLSTGVMEKELNLHATPVRGIEWVSLTSFLTFAYANLVSVGGKVKNDILFTDVTSGRIQSFRTDNNEESPISFLKVSYLKQYLAIMFKDQPFELWDLKSFTLLRTMPKNFPSVTAIEWSPLVTSKRHAYSQDKNKKKDLEPIFTDTTPLGENLEDLLNNRTATLLREYLVFTDTDGQLYYFTVEGSVVRDCTHIPPEAGMASITSIAWKGDHIVLGDADGNLTLWDLKGKMLKTIPTQRGWIKRTKFGPGKGNMKILVLFADSLDVWDVKDATPYAQVKAPQDIPKVHDADWAKSDKLVISTSDGCVRIMDMELKACSSSLVQLQEGCAPFIPNMLSPKATLNLKSLLQHTSNADVATLTTKAKGLFSPDESCLVEAILDPSNESSLECISAVHYGVAERSLHIARMFADEEGFRFWNIALHYLSFTKQKLCRKMANEAEELQDYNCCMFQLDTNYDLFCNNAAYKTLQLERTLLHESKRSSHSHTERCANTFLLLGQPDRAVQLLLETETENEHFYTDSLRACLIASLKTESKAQSVVKLVATNLIASGRISEGVQLLCLIGKGLDACRYLQLAGQWERSIWLAKSTLSYEESQEVIRKWADYLALPHVNQKTKAALALLTIEHYTKCLELLHSSRMVERAAHLLEACLEFGVVDADNSNDLFSKIWLNYARYLHSIGNRPQALHYCELAGDSANDLRREIEMLQEDVS